MFFSIKRQRRSKSDIAAYFILIGCELPAMFYIKMRFASILCMSLLPFYVIASTIVTQFIRLNDGRCLKNGLASLLKTINEVNENYCALMCSKESVCAIYMLIQTRRTCQLHSGKLWFTYSRSSYVSDSKNCSVSILSTVSCELYCRGN